MAREISPKKVMYVLMILLVIAIAFHITTNNDKYIFLVVLIAGLVSMLKPRIILDFFENEYEKGNISLKPWFSEKVYKLIGFCGGLFLVTVALARILFNVKI